MIKSFLSSLLFLGVFFCCSNTESSKEKVITSVPVTAPDRPQQKDLPDLKIQRADGTTETVKNLTGKIALVLFFPDCDHCQREAADIQRNIAGFKDYTLYFISSAPFEDINHFATTYQLQNYKNVVFVRSEVDSVIKAFGAIETPTLFLYDKDGKLINMFSGEIAVEVILKYI